MSILADCSIFCIQYLIKEFDTQNGVVVCSVHLLTGLVNIHAQKAIESGHVRGLYHGIVVWFMDIHA